MYIHLNDCWLMINSNIFYLHWSDISLSGFMPDLHIPWHVGTHLFLLSTDSCFIWWVSYRESGVLPSFVLYFLPTHTLHYSLNLGRETHLRNLFRPCALADFDCHSPAALSGKPGTLGSFDKLIEIPGQEWS